MPIPITNPIIGALLNHMYVQLTSAGSTCVCLDY